MKEHQGQWPIQAMARVLQVSVSGYYDWRKRPASKRTQENKILSKKIIEYHQASRATYGSPRIHKDLRSAGHNISLKRVARLMREVGISGKVKRQFRVTTTSKHSRPRADNLVNQAFSTAAPSRLWASDISYIATQEGWLYLAVTLDLFSRKVIGWAFSDRLIDDLCLRALEMALRQRDAPLGLIHHSDQGSQYASSRFRNTLETSAIDQSMSRKGNCYDNAVVESFFATLKTEEVVDSKYETRQQAKTSIFSYIEGFYNSKRRHSSLGYLSPDMFESRYSATLLNVA